MADPAQLWGWLDQRHDPLDGKPLAEALVRKLTGTQAAEPIEPSMIDPGSLRAPRLVGMALAALAGRFGPEGISTDGIERAKHSLGQSYPDQLARRSGTVNNPVDAVAFPAKIDEAMELLDLAAQYGFQVQPTGGATNVTGGFSAGGDKPRVALSMRRMNRLLDVNETDLTAEAEAGIGLADLEAQLGGKGFAMGHFPQSFQGATLGGAIAAHGSGQRSGGYGRMSDMLISAELATPRGIWRTGMARHAATGPWLGGLVAGSEGLFGVIGSVRVRIHRKPGWVEDRGWYLPSFAAGMDAARELAQRGRLSMVRLSDEAETQFLGAFRLAMKGRSATPLAERVFLGLKRAPDHPALLIAGFEGDRAEGAAAMAAAHSVLRRHGAVSLGAGPGNAWRRGRYELPYLRESLLRRGIGVDTFETVAPWGRLAALKQAATVAFRNSAGADATLICHLSHSYPDSACLYFTGIWAQSADSIGQWLAIKSALSEAFAGQGGAASHHHGVGLDHADTVRSALGDIGLTVLRGLKQSLDPDGILVSGMDRLVS